MKRPAPQGNLPSQRRHHTNQGVQEIVHHLVRGIWSLIFAVSRVRKRSLVACAQNRTTYRYLLYPFSYSDDHCLIFVVGTRDTGRSFDAGDPVLVAGSRCGLAQGVRDDLSPFIVTALVVFPPESLQTSLVHCSGCINSNGSHMGGIEWTAIYQSQYMDVLPQSRQYSRLQNQDERHGRAHEFGARRTWECEVRAKMQLGKRTCLAGRGWREEEHEVNQGL